MDMKGKADTRADMTKTEGTPICKYIHIYIYLYLTPGAEILIYINIYDFIYCFLESFLKFVSSQRIHTRTFYSS